RREAARMIDLTEPDPGLTVLEQLRVGIDTYLEHCKQHAQGVKVVYSGWGSADPEVQQIINHALRVQEDRIVNAVTPDAPASEFLRIAVRGWLAFMRSACHDWLDSDDITREDVCGLCTQTLIATLLALPEKARPAPLASLVETDLGG
ncbi:MAG: hypothetical protein ACXWXY_07235, partial [Aeromicrobium sp.]